MSSAARICDLDGIMHLPSVRELLVRRWRPARHAWPVSMLQNAPSISPPVFWHTTECIEGWTMRVHVCPAHLQFHLESEQQFYESPQIISAIRIAHHPEHGTVQVTGHHIWATSDKAWQKFNEQFPMRSIEECVKQE